MKKTKQNPTIADVAGIISIIVGIHYYLSYRWLHGLFSIWGIETLSIMTFEDLTFPFADVNISVILLSIFGFLGIFCWNLLSDKKSIHVKDVYGNFKLVKSEFLKKPFWAKITLVASFLILASSYLLILKPYVKYPSTKFEILYFAILLGIPIWYIFVNPAKRRNVLIFQMILMFSWANLFVNNVLEGIDQKESKNNILIEFTYKDELITASDSLRLLFHGHKYLITLKNNEKIQLYDTKNIDNISVEIK